jgi:ABC-type lipoprotein export system ATPase subunit
VSAEGAILRTRGLVKRYPRGRGGATVIELPDLDLVPGELTVVVGPSLSGKTTLVDLIAGWAEADAGHIERDAAGLPLGDWSKLAVIPQGLALLGELSVVENITLAPRLGASNTGEVDACLDAFDIAALRDRNPDEISVGERQRVMAARAILPQPTVLLADEPVAHQDARRAELVLDALQAAADAGAACLLVTREHDLARGDHSFELTSPG